MVSRRLKLKPNRSTEQGLDRTLFQLAGLYNWAVLKLFRDARCGVFYSRFELQALINGHGRKCGLNQQTMHAVVTRAHRAHHARQSRGRPARLKSIRNRLRCIPIRQDVHWVDRTHIAVPGLGRLKVRPDPRFPAGRIRCAYVIKRALGWYLTLVVDAEPKALPQAGEGNAVGVDFGFTTLATLSTGEKIPNPREYHRLERRLGQASRGLNYALLARLQQRLTNARRVRNHQISRDLLVRHSALYLSRDNYRALAQAHFGKSVHSAAIGQLITMLHAKSRPGGCRVVEVSNRNSTRGCSACGALTGPTGKRQLSVRQWSCACGAHHDRDVNAAMNALRAGAVLAHEMAGNH